MKYIYPAIFGAENRGIYILFPDLPGCLPCADNYIEAFHNAREGLTLHIYAMLEDGEELPAPSKLEEIELDKNEALALIEVDLEGFKPEWSLRDEQKR